MRHMRCKRRQSIRLDFPPRLDVVVGENESEGKDRVRLNNGDESQIGVKGEVLVGSAPWGRGLRKFLHR